MAVEVVHATQAVGTDAGNGEIRKAQWNEAHQVTGLGTMAEEDAADYYTAAEVDALVPPGAAKNNFTATSAPTVNDDSGDGYAVGSFWCWAARGLVWQCYDASSGAAVWALPNRPYVPYVAGAWYYLDPQFTQLNAGAANAASTIYYDYFELYEPIVVSDLGCLITTLSAGGNLRLGIYRHDNATRRPGGAVLAETGNISTASTGVVTADIIGSDVLLVPGAYWKANQMDNTTAIIAVETRDMTHRSVGRVGSTTAANVIEAQRRLKISLSSAETFGAFPNASSETFTELAGFVRGAALIAKAA